MDHNIAIHFHIRNGRKDENNTAPVYMRITVNGKRIEQSINRLVEFSKWSAPTGRMKGNTGDAKALNNHIDALRNKVHIAEREMILDGKEVTRLILIALIMKFKNSTSKLIRMYLKTLRYRQIKLIYC